MSQVLILPTPVSSSSFALGQLLTSPLDSNAVSFKPSVKPVYNKPTIKSHYQDNISHDEHGRFVASLGKATPSLDNAVELIADEMSLTSLASPSAAFEALRRDTESQSFLRKLALHRQPLYFVTAVQKLKNASYRRAPAKAGSIAAHQVRLPMLERRDSAELESEDEDAKESILAVELIKVACRVGAKDEPHGIDDIGYTWTYHSLDEPDLQLSIGLGKALRAKDLRALAGIVADEDLEQGYYDHYFNDEGLAGFSSD